MDKFYGEEYQNLQKVLEIIKADLLKLSAVEHLRGRIKSPESAIGKLKLRELQTDVQSAFDNLFDIIGVRVIVRFIDDVYAVSNFIKDNYEIIEIKDYIKSPKDNGYRSLHMIIKVANDNTSIAVEIQIRTISQDSWASLEHKMKYKKEIEHVKLISSELKRCADEMASIDISMQTINDMIHGSINKF